MTNKEYYNKFIEQVANLITETTLFENIISISMKNKDDIEAAKKELNASNIDIAFCLVVLWSFAAELEIDIEQSKADLRQKAYVTLTDEIIKSAEQYNETLDKLFELVNKINSTRDVYSKVTYEEKVKASKIKCPEEEAQIIKILSGSVDWILKYFAHANGKDKRLKVISGNNTVASTISKILHNSVSINPWDIKVFMLGDG